VPLALLDAAVVVPAYLVPLVLRFNGGVPSHDWRDFWILLPAIVKLCSAIYFRSHGQMWRYGGAGGEAWSCRGSRVSVLVLVDCSSRGGDTHSCSRRRSGARGDDAPGAIRFQSRPIPAALGRADRLDLGPADGWRRGVTVLSDIPAPGSLVSGSPDLVDDDPRNLGRAPSRRDVPRGGPRSRALGGELGAHQLLLEIPSATSDLIRDVASLCEKVGLSPRKPPSVRAESADARVTAPGTARPADRVDPGSAAVETDPRGRLGSSSGSARAHHGAGGPSAPRSRGRSQLEPARRALITTRPTCTTCW
jgi:hypothetical protein